VEERSVIEYNSVRQIEVHTADSLVPDSSPFGVEIAIATLKKYKLPDSDQILAELIQVRGETLRSEIHKLILFGIRKNFLVSLRSTLLYQFTRRAIKLTVIFMEYHCYQLHTKFYPVSFSQG
jgi:hypothetical protein